MLRIDDIPQQVADDIHASRRDLLRNPLHSPQFCGIMSIERRHRLYHHGKGEQMKKLLNFVGNILYVCMIIWDIIEFLALPAIFLVIGLLNSFPWQYYVISIGGYFALFIILEIILHFIFKALDKKYTPLIERKLEKYFNKNSNKD